MKLIPINMDYFIFQFDALNVFSRIRLHGASLLNLVFFNMNPQIDNEIVKFTTQIASIQIFTIFLTFFERY